MITLPNDCYCSDFSVVPKNWDKPGATTKGDWRIQYYFHDPRYKDYPKLMYDKLCIVKGRNRYKTLAGRWEAVKRLMENEMQLQQEVYNPIAKTRKAAAPANED